MSEAGSSWPGTAPPGKWGLQPCGLRQVVPWGGWTPCKGKSGADEPLGLWDGECFQGERGLEAWISLSSVGGRGPAGACVDFEPLPCRTEPKPREGWPPPGRPLLGCDSRNWALSVGPRFRGWVSCHFPSVMWPLACSKWAGRRLAVRRSSRQGEWGCSSEGRMG